MKKVVHDNHKWDLVIESPGRINIIGEHVDYNNGFVLPTAIDKTISFSLKKNGLSKTCNIYSQNFDVGFSFELDSIKVSDQQWENYILGVIHEINQLSDGLEGFDCNIDSNIPIGSGISSSAALECGLAFGLNELFNLDLSKLTIVELSQRAEHNYVGTKCGIMDQFASVMSRKEHVILLDCESLDYEYVPLHIEPYTLLLLNTNVTHDLSTGEYNIRRSQCESGVGVIQQKYPEVKSLRDVSLNMIETFRDELDPVIFNRCQYVVEETDRVLKSVEALRQDDLALLGKYLYETHDGLSKKYEVSCPELDFLVDYARQNDNILGARMMGGGFGGCTINLIRKDAVEEFIPEISAAYSTKFGIRLTAFEAVPDEGTHVRSRA
jgi:galactokinase